MISSFKLVRYSFLALSLFGLAANISGLAFTLYAIAWLILN